MPVEPTQPSQLRPGFDSLASFLEATEDPAIVAGPDDRIVVANRPAASLFGYSGLELVGRPLDDLVMPGTGPLSGEQLGERTTVVARHRDGHTMRLSVAFRSVPIDRSELRAAYFRPDPAADDPRAIVDRLPVPVSRFDRTGRLVYANLATLTTLGAKAAELHGRLPTDFGLAIEAGQSWLDSVIQAAEGGMGRRFELALPRPEPARWYAGTATPERDSSGQVASVVVTLQNVTDRQRLTQLAEAVELQFRRVTEGSQDLISQHDANGVFLYASPAALTILDRHPASLVGKALVEFVHEGDRQALHHAFREAAVRDVGRLTTFRLLRPDGSPVWCEMTAHWSVSLPATAATVTCIIRDITERIRGEEILRGASRMEATATLAAGVAHDFNNLMTAILGNAELLLSDPAFPDAPSRIGQIAEAAKRGGALAQQLLAYARGGKYQAQVVSLNDIVTQSMALQKHALPPRIQLEAILEPRDPHIEGDPVQIGQVLTNLLINAGEAIPGSGRIMVRTEAVTLAPAAVTDKPGLAPGPITILEVADTGKGIDPAALPRIFEPFFSTKFQGRGLGLAAAYGIVKNHRGYIAVNSCLGKGTTIRIYLPAIPAAPRDPSPPEEPYPTGTETLLLVDDDEAVIDVTKSILERLHYTVLVARHGIEAVEIAGNHPGPIDLALLDMGMPLAGGAEAFPFLKASRPEMKVLISSGYEMNEVVQGLLAAGADAFLQKPYRVTTLARGLRRVLDRRVAGLRLDD
ncbi:MAG: PAS domain S-box protein [Gemmatimonadetes bacterium]|nr:PAS domain S-box protein [Gemmatimonadota bacterium]